MKSLLLSFGGLVLLMICFVLFPPLAIILMIIGVIVWMFIARDFFDKNTKKSVTSEPPQDHIAPGPEGRRQRSEGDEMTKDDILATVGLIVIESQAVEALLNVILTYVLQDGASLTYDRILQIEKSHRRKTLGFFFKAMKERADYSSLLEEAFDRFLENRNKLVHRFREVDGNQLCASSS